MRWTLTPIVWGLVVVSAAGAAEAPPALRWFAGDCGVLAWPASRFTATERIWQAGDGGLSWLVVCNLVREGAIAAPDEAARLSKLRTDEACPVLGWQWNTIRPVNAGLLCIGMDPDLPLPGDDAQDVINWANALGGVAILLDPGLKLKQRVDLLTGLAAFEAFREGKWNPECREGGAWDELLATGQRLTIVGGTQEPAKSELGRGAVATYLLCRENTEREIVAAIRAGRTVVAERDQIRLNFTVNGEPAGSVVRPDEGKVVVAFQVIAREPVDEVKIIGNTRSLRDRYVDNKTVVLHRSQIGGKEATKAVTLELDRSTRYLRAVAATYRPPCQTLTSPVYIGGASDPLPDSSLEKKLELTGTMIRNLNWEDEDKARETLERILADHEIGPPAALLLARNTGEGELARIRPLLKSPQPVIRALTAFVFLRVQGEAALPLIFPLLEDTERVPRTYAARLLARFARAEHLELALRAARDPWPQVRCYGLIALSRMPCEESLLAFRRALYERSDAVRETAQARLCHMLGVTRTREAEFLAAFREGKLDATLLEASVTIAELRPLVEKAAAARLGSRYETIKPPEEKKPE